MTTKTVTIQFEIDSDLVPALIALHAFLTYIEEEDKSIPGDGLRYADFPFALDFICSQIDMYGLDIMNWEDSEEDMNIINWFCEGPPKINAS